MATYMYIRNMSLDKGEYLITKVLIMLIKNLPIHNGYLQCFCHTYNQWDIVCACSKSCLLRSATLYREKIDAGSYIKGTDTFRTIEFMCSDGHQIHIQRLYIDGQLTCGLDGVRMEGNVFCAAD